VTLARREFLRPWVVEAEQAAAQRGARQCRRALVQVGEVEQVGKDEIAVEAHEGADIQRQGQYPAGRRQVEKGGVQQAGVGQRPAQGRHTGQRQFGEDAGGRDGQALVARFQLPRFADIGVQHRPHDDEGDAHVRHAHAEAGRRQRVSQFVQSLGDDQRCGEAEQALGRKRIDHRAAEGIPLAEHQQQAEAAQQQDGPQHFRAEQAAEVRRDAGEQALRTKHGNAEEQVMVQPPAPLRPMRADRAGGQAVGGFEAGAQELVAVEEFGEGEYLFGFRVQRGGFGNLRDDLRGRRAPAHQAFELQPADAVKAVDHRVLDHPGRRAVSFGGGFGDAQVLTQRRQWLHGGHRVHSPDHSRSAASGRRSR
jgi:hypothetical protein